MEPKRDLWTWTIARKKPHNPIHGRTASPESETALPLKRVMVILQEATNSNTLLAELTNVGHHVLEFLVIHDGTPWSHRGAQTH